MGFERDSGVRSAKTVSVETNSETALCVLGRNQVLGLLIARVDDLCWAVMPQHALPMNHVLEDFAVRRIESGTFLSMRT